LNKEYTQAIADELKNLPHPTLVMWGDKDPFQKPAYADKLAAAIQMPSSSGSRTPGTG